MHCIPWCGAIATGDEPARWARTSARPHQADHRVAGGRERWIVVSEHGEGAIGLEKEHGKDRRAVLFLEGGEIELRGQPGNLHLRVLPNQRIDAFKRHAGIEQKAAPAGSGVGSEDAFFRSWSRLRMLPRTLRERQVIDLAPAEELGKALAGQGVQFLVGRQSHQPTKTAEVQLLDRPFRKYVAELDR